MSTNKKKAVQIIGVIILVLLVAFTSAYFADKGEEPGEKLSSINGTLSDIQGESDKLSDKLEAFEEVKNQTEETQLIPIDEDSVWYGKSWQDLRIKYDTDDKAVLLLRSISYVEHGTAGVSLQLVSRAVDFAELAQLEKAEWAEIPAFLDTLTPVQLDYLSYRVVDAFEGALSIINKEEYITGVLELDLATAVSPERYSACTKTQAICLAGYLLGLLEERGVNYEWERYDISPSLS